ncbi:hypothetical protein IID22_04125 [Patescibacteria group bacterium]|nr:hypothetical protein [Patescibacteria group bacterium]
MKQEIKGPLFEANRDVSGPSQESEPTPRDDQREGVLKEQGKEGLRELNLYYDLLDATLDAHKRKSKRSNTKK